MWTICSMPSIPKDWHRFCAQASLLVWLLYTGLIPSLSYPYTSRLCN
jgi:hypothetical protein